jgi:hypothetical protein
MGGHKLEIGVHPHETSDNWSLAKPQSSQREQFKNLTSAIISIVVNIQTRVIFLRTFRTYAVAHYGIRVLM